MCISPQKRKRTGRPVTTLLGTDWSIRVQSCPGFKSTRIVVSDGRVRVKTQTREFGDIDSTVRLELFIKKTFYLLLQKRLQFLRLDFHLLV